MSTALELVYQYRQLAGKCESRGLSMEEIDMMNTIEALFRARAARQHEQPRRFARERVDLVATLRARGHEDRVTIADLNPNGMVCRRAPYLEPEDTVEIVIDDAECGLSYRFKARVTWHRDEADDYTAGLELLGVPLLIRYNAEGKPEAIADAA